MCQENTLILKEALDFQILMARGNEADYEEVEINKIKNVQENLKEVSRFQILKYGSEEA